MIKYELNGKSVKLQLAVPADTEFDSAEIVHSSAAGASEKYTSRVYTDENDEKYVVVSINHFSTFEITRKESVEDADSGSEAAAAWLRDAKGWRYRKREAIMKESKKARAERVARILAILDQEYGTDGYCHLHHETPWQLLFATIMSAQCTDARVNLVTKDLFKKYPDLKAFAEADLEELEQDIHSTGFYHNKAKNIIGAAQMLLSEYGGEMPSEIEKLTKLPGVGRKTANVIRGNIFHDPSIVVDTHVKRISKLLGLTTTLDPEKAEYELMEVLPKDHWILWNVDIIDLGRSTCISGHPRCAGCILQSECPSAGIAR